MIIKYTLNENDFLTHQLLVASKSDRVKKKRTWGKILVPISYGVLGLLFLIQDRIELTISFSILAILWFFVYPIWDRNRYIRHYRNFIRDNYKDRVGDVVTLELTKDLILATDKASESKILTTELVEILEVPSVILIRLKGGQSFILPKEQISDIEALRSELKELAGHLKIKYETDNEWKWR